MIPRKKQKHKKNKFLSLYFCLFYYLIISYWISLIFTLCYSQLSTCHSRWNLLKKPLSNLLPFVVGSNSLAWTRYVYMDMNSYLLQLGPLIKNYPSGENDTPPPAPTDFPQSLSEGWGVLSSSTMHDEMGMGLVGLV